MRVVRTRRGARIEQGGLVLSDVLRRPGATHSLFDVLAAAVAALARGPRAALLGFAAGGVVAPLRAMGYGHPLEAVDLSLEGEALFRELSSPWCGAVHVHRGEASAWLRRRRQTYDVILEDLSAPSADSVTKPDVSLDVLPTLMKVRLRKRGLVVLNVLPVPGRPWTRLLPHLAAPYGQAQVVLLDEWENRILLLSDELEPPRRTSHLMRRALAAIGSQETNQIHVRALKRPARPRSRRRASARRA